MAELPDPIASLTGQDREIYEHMTAVRAHAEGRNTLGDVYVRMFNNAPVAEKVGALGEHLRFHGTLPDSVREMVILRFAIRQGVGYEWSHHQRPAHLAGLGDETIVAITRGEIPGDLPAAEQAVLRAVDAIVGKASIPADVQKAVVEKFGTAGIVEVVAICGLYSIMGYMVISFDIPIEPGLPALPF